MNRNGTRGSLGLLSIGLGLGLPFIASCIAETARDGAEATATTEQAATTNPLIDFVSRPSYIPSNTVVFTFDDGPDDQNTPRVLDILKTNGIKATFFLNTINYTTVSSDTTAQAIVKRIVNEGHEIGNHTVHHFDLSTLTASSIESEIAGDENTLRPFIGSRRLSLLRAPYGIPYDPTRDTTQFAKVAPVVANHAVHVGWHISALDAETCSGNKTCILNQVEGALAAGSYGIILMHSTQGPTADGLQELINYVKSHGYVFRTVEDVVRGRFASTTTASAEIVDAQFAPVSRSPTADAYVRDGTVAPTNFAATNFGAATELDIKTATAGFDRDGYLKYDISGLTTISKAKLRIFMRMDKVVSTSVPVAVYSVASTSWTEAGINWNNKPARGTTALASVNVFGITLGAYDLDVTSYVKQQKTANATAVSFALHATATSQEFVAASSREAPNSRPQLVVTP